MKMCKFKFDLRNGDLLTSTATLICHQTNCCKGFGSGVARAVKEAYPIVAEKHLKACESVEISSELLGKIQPVKVNDSQYVVNMFSQDKFGYDGAQYTSYDAFWKCLQKIVDFCNINGFHSVAFPYKIASVRGGAVWEVIEQMIKSTFENTDINVEIWKYDRDN